MRLFINGEERNEAAVTIAHLVARLGLDGRKVAIERNLAIVPRTLWSETALGDDDRIEIVHFVGGG